VKTKDELKTMLQRNGLPRDYFNYVSEYTPKLAAKMLDIAMNRSPRHECEHFAIEFMDSEKEECIRLFTKKAKKKAKVKTTRTNKRRNFDECFTMMREMEYAMKNFINRVEIGEVFSKKTYKQFKEILETK